MLFMKILYFLFKTQMLGAGLSSILIKIVDNIGNEYFNACTYFGND